MRSIYISGTGPGSGKSVVVLGVMELLAGRGRKVGFFRPLVADPPVPDPLTSLVASRFGARIPLECASGATSSAARELLARGDDEKLLETILESYHRLTDGCDLVVCAGTDYQALHTAMEFEFNVEVARNVGAALVAVVPGQGRTAGEIATAVGVLAETLEEKRCDLLATVVNRVDPAAVPESAERLRSAATGESLVFVLPADHLLDRPTVGEIKEALGARQLYGDLERLDGEVLHFKVAAMELPHFLDRLEEASLVITPGDRADIVIGTLLADAASTYPKVAGVILTGGFEPAPQVQRLFAGLRRTHVPILAVREDTFATATEVNAVPAGIGAGSARKIARALGVFEAGVDRDRLGRRISVMRSTRVTPLMFQNDLLGRARADRRHIVLPEGAEERILRAAEIVRLREVVDLTLLGNPAEVRERIAALGLSLAGVPVVDPVASEWREGFGATYHELRKHKGISPQMAFDAMADVSSFGTMMVHAGLADGMVSGSVHTTQHTIRPALEVIRTRPGCAIASSVFFMCLPDRVLVYGDCAINPDPTAEQLAHIAISSADTAASFGVEPLVAMLSYSTGESGKGADVDKVKEATRIARGLRPELKLEGPIQYDAAIDPGVAKVKLPGSEVAGHATVFIFPDLNAGNSAYKAVQRAADAVAIGPVLQGLNKPVNDLSRGCTVTDIVNTIAITAIQAQGKGGAA